MLTKKPEHIDAVFIYKESTISSYAVKAKSVCPQGNVRVVSNGI